MIDQFKRHNRVEDDKMLAIVTPLLRGQALQMLKRGILKNQQYDWNEFKEELVETFRTDTRERKIRKQLRELKHKNNFDEFITKFRELSMQVEDLPEDELLRIFIDAVKPKTRFEIISKKVDNIDEAMRIARVFEECYGENKQKENKVDDVKQVNYVKSVFPKKLRKKFKRFGQEKFRSGGKFVSFRRRKSDDDRNPDRSKKKEVTCYKCKKPGHISRNCRVSLKDDAYKVNTIVEAKESSESESDDEEKDVRTVLNITNSSGLRLP